MDQKRYPPENELKVSERDFWARLASLDDQIHAYEDEVLQGLARSLIPIELLETEAMKQSGVASMDEKARDCLLRELLRWFKYEFFTWTDKPKCDHCQGATAYFAHLDPTPEELQYGARRIEGYRCETCSKETRFPRYNDPAKLLSTRTGRCGEWANCFTLCCRSLNFETRYVLDWTDHVWTEVYSSHERRWLHCDPCENACDTPLMYEEGWGKKLTYVIAFSNEEVVDVTWRYSRKHRSVWRRRLACKESNLIRFIDELNKKRRQNVSADRRKVLDDRALVECVELLWPRLQVKEHETEGRTSGDLKWRQERGELGNEKSHQERRSPFVFRLSEEEIQNLEFVLEYYSASDDYHRPGGPSKHVPNWETCIYESETVFRKVEHDWKTAYLARRENAAEGRISWKFDFSSDEVEVDHVTVKVERKTFENGSVQITYCQDDYCCSLNGDELMLDKLDSPHFEIKVVLTGGNGPCAWQHAQLFRAQLDDHTPAPSLIVKAKLRRKSNRTCR